MASVQMVDVHDASAGDTMENSIPSRTSWLEARKRKAGEPALGWASGKWKEAMHAAADQARQERRLSPRQGSTEAYEAWKNIIDCPQLEEQLAGMRNLWEHNITRHSSRSPPFGAPSPNRVIGMLIVEC
jgi:hypothetical protein